MRKIAPIGKRSYAGKKFKSVGPNELNASDKNFVRNNISKYTIQQLANRVGKSIEVIEKFFKKEKLVQILDIQNPKAPSVDAENLFVEVQIEKKADLKIKKEPKIKPLKLLKELKVEPLKEPKVKLLKPQKEKPPKEPKIKPPKESKVKLLKEPKERQKRGPKFSEAVAKKIAFIKENHEKFSILVLAKALDLSVSAIKYHLTNLGLRARGKDLPPSEEHAEILNFIKENHKEYSLTDLATLFNITETMAVYFIDKVTKKTPRRVEVKKESAKTIEFLKENYRTMTAKEMSEVLGVSQNRVRYVCERKGFLRTPEETTVIRNRFNKIVFTTDQEAYMLANHGKVSMGVIAAKFGKNRSSVVKFFTERGMKITKAQQDKLSSQNLKDYFKKIEEEKNTTGLSTNQEI